MAVIKTGTVICLSAHAVTYRDGDISAGQVDEFTTAIMRESANTLYRLVV